MIITGCSCIGGLRINYVTIGIDAHYFVFISDSAGFGTIVNVEAKGKSEIFAEVAEGLAPREMETESSILLGQEKSFSIPLSKKIFEELTKLHTNCKKMTISIVLKSLHSSLFRDTVDGYVQSLQKYFFYISQSFN
ncbi:hypothetical protein RF11_00965 [Thelohanellus kitauei]|uniref:Proteasome assembly chaperone 3 n=1 Tax=Thelohanellus kitauei TaxID=669202 RepID=A0A0C2MYW8_THEKT|nr:hypothetical protein RF11_00965 [Thelohanellus kitauei]